MSLLKIDRITKRFGGVTANENISFDVKEGQILALIGPNGAGKTTCFNMIAGVFPPSEGKIYYDGQDITGKKPHELNAIGIARTFQIVKPLAKLTVFDNLMVASLAKSKNIKEAQEKAKEMLSFTHLESLQHIPAGQLSIGNLKRLEVARAIATRPKLLLMDEPMGGLTPSEVDEAIKLIHQIRTNGTTIVIIEHIMKAVMAVSDHIVVLQNGVMIANGDPKAVMNDETVIKAYLGDGYVKSH
ncbi:MULTISPECIES: ABC transporter ATP-binding protein [Paenibacillus]|uniref:ABC transporter ATP-binding protein n=1 Tax=Paenibacillus TaxID=44249 RepID=UPI0010B6C3E9|nr:MULTISPECIES: ABC transporter ATP-binding protein [Paenibacillus]NTZ20112.1 ABC transporter ATP-binding protein [Paenibacillus sp. JMULE4]GCL73300.1 ABC transporter ATP-binding protein [Paenibacillus naphthalenovorans]